MKKEKELLEIESKIFSTTGGQGEIDRSDITTEFYKRIIPDYVHCGNSRVVTSCHYEKFFNKKPKELNSFGEEVVFKFPIYGNGDFSSGLYQNSHEIKVWENANENQSKYFPNY